ncbi:MAG: hypothetical protein ACREC0_06070 [Methylocella sp.]
MQNYEYRFAFVAFIDILGWREIVEQSARDPKTLDQIGAVLDQLGSYSRHQKMFEQLNHPFGLEDRLLQKAERGSELETTVHYGQFSDSIILSVFPAVANSDTSRTKFHRFLGRCMLEVNVQHIFVGCLRAGFFARGGIAAGQMYHHDNVAFGPALTHAYLVEQTALYPRIVLHKDLVQEFTERGESTIRRDRNVAFIDSIGLILKSDKDLFVTLGSRIGDNLIRFRDRPKIVKKYRWLATYYNNVVAENENVGLSPIAVRKVLGTALPAKSV